MSTPPDITVTFRACGHRYGRRTLFRDLSAGFRSGEVIGVTGLNGAGKSTLLKLVAGLVRPSSGSVEVAAGGRPLTPDERRRALGYASPETMPYEALTVRENLRFGAALRGLSGLGDDSVVTTLGLGERLDQPAAELSSGYRQRLKLALALLHRPSLLLLDEPGVTLDDAGQAQVAAVVTTQRERGLCLLATNDPRDLAHANRIIRLGA